MDRRSDQIRDSKLDTRFDAGFTIHTYREVLTSLERRVVQRQEYWRRESRIGAGAYGCVWLEKCIHGHRDVELRAVKEVSTKPLRNGKQINYSRELEAIAKFSHKKVSGHDQITVWDPPTESCGVCSLFRQVIGMVRGGRRSLHRNGVSRTRRPRAVPLEDISAL